MRTKRLPNHSGRSARHLLSGHRAQQAIGLTESPAGLRLHLRLGLALRTGAAHNAALAGAALSLVRRGLSPQRKVMLSAVNDISGDQLRGAANPLTIAMSLRHQGQTLGIEKSVLAQALSGAAGKIVVPGLCMNYP